MKRILLVDDHAVVRAGLRKLLEEAIPDLYVEETSDSQEAVKAVKLGSWDAVILDISLPGTSGLEALKRIRSAMDTLPVLILSMYPEDQYGIRVLRAGASGYLTKTCVPENLVEAIKAIMRGQQYVSPTLAQRLISGLREKAKEEPHQSLSDREYQVFCMIASGKTVSEIAKDVFLSVKTVSTHRSRILTKMHMRNNAELTHYAIKKRLVD